jgi:hypothetical protein
VVATEEEESPEEVGLEVATEEVESLEEVSLEVASSEEVASLEEVSLEVASQEVVSLEVVRQVVDWQVVLSWAELDLQLRTNLEPRESAEFVLERANKGNEIGHHRGD